MDCGGDGPENLLRRAKPRSSYYRALKDITVDCDDGSLNLGSADIKGEERKNY
jgi:hypothetical protein